MKRKSTIPVVELCVYIQERDGYFLQWWQKKKMKMSGYSGTILAELTKDSINLTSDDYHKFPKKGDVGSIYGGEVFKVLHTNPIK